MKFPFARCVWNALLLPLAMATVLAGENQATDKSDALAELERKLLGVWRGPPCGGDYTFNNDGTFVLRNFTPGGNTLTGVWSVRWEALPPTLVLEFKSSDFRKKDPDREEFKYLGKALELKLLELNRETLVYRLPNDSGEKLTDVNEQRFERRAHK
jgi:hypothetical protein